MGHTQELLAGDYIWLSWPWTTDFPDLTVSPAYCRVGSCDSLSGQLVTRQVSSYSNLGDRNLTGFLIACTDNSARDHFCQHQDVKSQAFLNSVFSPPLCRVGSWNALTGLGGDIYIAAIDSLSYWQDILTIFFISWGWAPFLWLAWFTFSFNYLIHGIFRTDSISQGLGTLTDRPTGFTELLQAQRGWAPLIWLAQVSFLQIYHFALGGLQFSCAAGLESIQHCSIGLQRLRKWGWAPLFWLAQGQLSTLVSFTIWLPTLRSILNRSSQIFHLQLTTFILIWRQFYIHFFHWLIVTWSGTERALLLAKGALEWLFFVAQPNHWHNFLICEGHGFVRFSEPALGLSWLALGYKSGPKSRRCVARQRLGWLLLALLGYYLTLTMQHSRGEGCGLAMKATEVPHPTHQFLEIGTKPHGTRPPACESTPAGPATAFGHMSQVTKRSLLRAYKRAQQQGMAWYRGQHYTVADLERMGCKSTSTSPGALTSAKQQDLRHCNWHHATKRRLKMWQWNCSGLSVPKFDEVKAWLVMHQIDIAVLLETRWTYDATWQDPDWHMIHSGDGPHRGKGIAILVSRRLCNGSQLQWHTHDSGRLVHLRINLRPRSLDVLACYQHSYQPTQACRVARDRWWTLLERVLAQLPGRNCLALLGDFNCSLGASPRSVGTSTFGWCGKQCSGTVHPDQSRFAQLLRHFALVALNTWSARLGPTFVHGSTASRIDFACVRQPYADGDARQVKYLWDSPFLNQTEYGHAPMLFTIAKHWIPVFAHHRIQAVSMQQRNTSRQAYVDQTSEWLDFAQCSASQLQATFAHHSGSADQFMEEIHQQMLKTFCDHFPAGRTLSAPPAWRLTMPTLQNKWEHRRNMQRPGPRNLRNIFHVWFHASRFMFLKRLHRKQAFLVRSKRFQEVVDCAVDAAAQHNTHKLFQIINRFAPKQTRKQIQLRTSEGRMASPVESVALLNKFVADTWAGPQSFQMTFEAAPGVPFSVRQLERALALIPPGKAVAKPFAPGVVWKQHASILAPALHAKLLDWWSTTPPQIPCSWRHGWLFLIPKASKTPDSPHHLRPLALQEPVGKAILGLIIRLAMTEANDHLAIFPVWAYLVHRSTLDAIRRVSLHCAEIRELLQFQRSTPHKRVRRQPQYSLYGGLQICLDLRCAFDCVDRRRLFQRLHQLNISQSLIQLLTTWHEHSVYYVQHDHADCPIAIGRGVRQDCKAAPGLWNFFVVLLLHDLMDYVPLRWIQRHLTIYADDFHIGSKFVSFEEFQYCRKVVGILFSLLESMQLRINPDKSVVILEMRGSRSHALRPTVTRRDRDGEKMIFYKLDSTSVSIPIHRTAKYLGVMICYGNFEDLSLKHRLSLMHTGFRRMQKWLLGKHSLSVKQRYQLWLTCIYPILSYGICATGLTSVGIKLATTQMTIMLRKLMHDHSYVTRRTNQHVFAIHKFFTPAQLLHGTATGLWRTTHERDTVLPAHDLARHIDWSHLQQLVSFLDHLQATESSEKPWTPLGEACYASPFFQCAQCDFCTDQVSQFRKHCTQVHGHTMYRTQHVKLSDYTMDGLPTCKFCHQTFTTWRMFTAHIQRGCQELLPGPAPCTTPLRRIGASLGSLDIMQPHLADAAARGVRLITPDELHHLRQQAFGDRLLHIVQERLWDRVAADSEICQYLSSRCVICDHQFTRCQELHQHFRLQHAELWEYAPQKSIQLTNLFSSESPCACCGALFKTHSCPTWSQIAVLLVNGAGLDMQINDPVQEVRQRCELCLECFTTSTDLVRHLQDRHGLQGLSYNESRDSLDGTSACAHCGQLFQTLGGLKSHVVQGRCLYFNPQATAETKPVDENSKQACLDGKLLTVLQDPMVRMRLTVICQACGKGCKRAADLALHLQTAHSRLWRKSQRLTLIMVDAFYQHQCFCNPSSGVHRTQHVCLPFRQLAMAFHRMGVEPFAPTVITDKLLKDILADTLPRAAKYRLERALVHRTFSDTWQDSEILKLMREHCILCGAQPAPSDMALHLREEHQCNHEMFLFYMEQLLPIALEPNLDHYQCHLCDLVFNLPSSLRPDETLSARAQIALSHLRGACPVLIQLAQLFGALLNGGHLIDGTVRHGGLCPDEGGLWGPGASLPRQVPPAGREPPADQSQASRRPKRQRRGDGGATSSHGGHTEGFGDPGHSSGPTRPGAARTQKNGSIHSFFESRTDRRSSSHDAGDGPMETKDGGYIHSSDDAAAPTSGADDAERHENPSREDSRCQGDGRPLHHLPGQGTDLGRQELPISQVGPGHPVADPGQETAHQCGQDGTELGGADGTAYPQGSCDQIPCIAGPGCADRQNSALASTDSPEARQGLRPFALPDAQCHLDGRRSDDEATQPGTITSGVHPAGHGGSKQAQRPRQGEGQEQAAQEEHNREVRILSSEKVAKLTQIMCRLRLTNDSNWCYGNASLHSLIWCLLCLQIPMTDLWGPHLSDLLIFIQQHAHQPAKLCECEWFQAIVKDWGATHAQKDSAEFIQRALHWLRAAAFDMRWERRIETADCIHVHDSNSNYTPITLIIPERLHLNGQCQLSQLVLAWTQEHSMCAALLDAPSCLCFHVDRFYRTPDGEVQKSLCRIDIDTEVTMPVFRNQRLGCATAGYIPVAGVAHFGSDMAGHCKAMLKMQPTLTAGGQPAAWLVTEDDHHPTPMWQCPAWFASNLVVIWMLRTDCLRLPVFLAQSENDAPADAQKTDKPDSALLQLL